LHKANFGAAISKMINDKKVIKAWTMYDWANSAYNLIINSAIFPSYFTAIVPATVLLFGTEVKNESVASWAISAAYIIVACISPLLSAIADYKGNKKSFMRAFTMLGAFCCMALFFFQKTDGQTNTWYGVALSIIACVGYCGSLVFYNAYLPEIASKDQQDTVSARGFTMGYVGSVSLLIVCLAFILLNEKNMWVASSIPARVAFVLVGIWWLLWSQIPFKHLPNSKANAVQQGVNIYRAGYDKLGNVWKELKSQSILKKYLVSFAFITMGVQTVMFMATYFAAKEIKLKQSELIITILLIQLIAIGGAFLFAKVAKQKGSKLSISIMVLIWIGICIAAYSKQIVNSVNSFYVLACVVGVVMGGIQSTTRSTYSKLLPQTQDVTSYFSFYDVVEKLSIVIGTASFGLMSNVMSMRESALLLGVYFIIGLIILLGTDLSKTKFANETNNN
jgi:MFS transporter, UMF1 family